MVKALGQAGSVTVTDDVIKMVPKLMQEMMGRSDCDTEKYASPCSRSLTLKIRPEAENLTHSSYVLLLM